MRADALIYLRLFPGSRCPGVAGRIQLGAELVLCRVAWAVAERQDPSPDPHPPGHAPGASAGEVVGLGLGALAFNMRRKTPFLGPQAPGCPISLLRGS